MKFERKWIELEKIIILNKVTQTQKDNAACFVLFVDHSFYSYIVAKSQNQPNGPSANEWVMRIGGGEWKETIQKKNIIVKYTEK